jgi:hypothetical protein
LNGTRVLRDAKDTFHATDYTACDTTDCPADSSANRTSRPTAYSRPLLGTTNDALGVNPCRHRQNGQPEGSDQSVSFHSLAPQSCFQKVNPKVNASSLPAQDYPNPAPTGKLRS